MPTEAVVELARMTLKTALLVGLPILAIATLVALLINVVQVLTSIQDSTVATVPRLIAAAVALFLLMPWMVRKLAAFTVEMLGDFHRCLG